MTLEEAIIHAEEVVEEQDMKAGFDTDNQTYTMSEVEREKCKKCAAEHRQLAEWLRELKAVHDEIDDADDEDEIFIGYLRKKMRKAKDDE